MPEIMSEGLLPNLKEVVRYMPIFLKEKVSLTKFICLRTSN